MHQLIDADSGEVIVPKLHLATTFWQRFRGLQLRRALAPDEGLLLTPCHSIHTHWMRFAIDAAMLDADGVVLAICPALRPWRMAGPVAATRSVVETIAGALAAKIQIGVRTRVVRHVG